MGPGARRWIRRIVLVVAIWTLIALSYTVTEFTDERTRGREVYLGDVFVAVLRYNAVWYVLTPLCIWLAERVQLTRGRRGRFFAIHVPASIAAAVIAATTYTALLGYFPPWHGPWSRALLTHLHFSIAIYWIVVGSMLASRYYVQYYDREAQLARAELHALKAQLRPHFLFNTLNTVSSLIRQQPLQAEAMLSRLGDLLRITLRDHHAEEVPLADELAFVDGYLEIEQARFGDRLRVTRAIDPAALDALVPHLVLQPLVENAVRHGIGPRAAGGTIELRAERRGGRIALEVRDDGVGCDAFADGVGLANTRARLAHLYGTDHRFAAGPAPGGGFAVAIELPYRAETRA